MIDMKKLCVLAFLVLVSLAELKAQHNSITTFILVRHAEKSSDGTDDPDLTPEGKERAQRLTSLLQNTPADAVYSTRFKRTKNTIMPLAQKKNLEVRIYETVRPEVIDEWISKHAGGTVVVAGHSNTLPQILNLLIGKQEYQTLPETAYNNIFIVSVAERGKLAKVTLLNF
jgi:2,3-bisphosphoglycerate-dependent phosphoglycerate mutase